MELLQLRYFLEVAESEHVTHSAQKLRVSQPSLTQAISRLERELGVQLFEPEGRGIRLTEAGRFYSKRIAKAVGEIDSATSELARFDEERSSIVRINVVSASNIVVDAVAEWRAQHPAAKFQIVSRETTSKIEPCDIEVRMQTGKTPEAKGARLFKERIMLAVPTTNGDETEERALRETKEPDAGFRDNPGKVKDLEAKGATSQRATPWPTGAAKRFRWPRCKTAASSCSRARATSATSACRNAPNWGFAPQSPSRAITHRSCAR